MANSLVQTTFQAGPSDALAALDVYKNVSGTNVINRIQKLNIDSSILTGGGFGMANAKDAINLLSDLAKQTSNAIAGSKSAKNQLIATASALASKASTLLTGTPDQIKLNKEGLMDRLLQASDAIQSSLRRTDGNILDAIMKDTPLRSFLMVNVAGIKNRISVADIRDIHSIGRLMNDLAQSEVFSAKDNGALSGVIGAIIGQASKLGIPNAFDAIAGAIEDNALLIDVIKTAIPHVIEASNMEQLYSISNSDLGKVINSIYPDFLPSLVQGYSWTPKLRQVNKQVYTMQGLMDTASNINTNWNLTILGTKPTVDMSTFVGGSDDFNEMVETTVPSVVDPTQRIYAIATTFKKVSTKTRLRRLFPALALSSLDRVVKVNAGVVSPNLA